MRSVRAVASIRYGAIVTLILCFAALIIACNGPQTVSSSPIEDIANDICTNMGQVRKVIKGNADRMVIVFEEYHNSPAVQLEICVMLNRLYKTYDMRCIGMEGLFADEAVLSNLWGEPSYQANHSIRSREDIIVQLVEDGEIRSAEMMALTYADVEVVGIENPDEYNVDIPDEALGAPDWYLCLIAERGLTQDEIKQVNDLIDQGKIKEAVEYTISSDEFTKQRYDSLNDPTLILTCRKIVEILDDIEAEAEKVGASVSSEDRNHLEAYRAYYDGRAKASVTMAKRIVALAQERTSVPVAMPVGAGHTDEVVKVLEDAGVSFAVIRPLSFGNPELDLPYEAFLRKYNKQSVDEEGALGALLDGRHPPRPIVDELWFKSKSDLFFLSTVIARAIHKGEPLPLEDTLKEVTPRLSNIQMLSETLEVEGDEAIFCVRALDVNSRSVDIWVRCTVDMELTDKTLDERLKESLGRMKGELETPNYPDYTNGVVDRITSDCVAVFSPDPQVVRAERIKKR